MAIAFDALLGTNSLNAGQNTMPVTTTAAAASDANIFLAFVYKNATSLVSGASGGGLNWFVLDDTAFTATLTTRIAWLRAYAPTGLASSTTITINLSATASAVGNVIAVSFTGFNNPASLDSVSQNTSGTAWSIAPQANLPNELALAASHVTSTAAPTDTASAGTQIGSAVWNSGSTRALAAQYLLASGAGAQTISGSWTGTSLATPLESALTLAAPVVRQPEPTFNPIPFMAPQGGVL